MKSYTHLSNPELLQLFGTLLTQDRLNTAVLIGVIAEIDERKLYLPAGYESMHAFCEGAYGMSEDEADNRIRVARTARAFPAIFAALADGRLHLSAVLVLSRRLTPENAGELLAAAAGKTKREIREWLEQRFPSTAVLTWVEELVSGSGEPGAQSVPERIEPVSVPERIHPASQPVGHRARVNASGAVQFNLSPRGQERLRHVQNLLAHRGCSHDIREIFERSLEALEGELEKQKFGANTKRRARRRASTNPRDIPADVKWSVWQRAGGQCTFVSESGHRCEARGMLEFDHIEPVARGGESTVDNLRLRCRAHNQYEAERTFGAEFMRHKREEARERTDERRHKAAAAQSTEAPTGDSEKDVAPWLRTLGFRADQVRLGVELCKSIPDASLEERVRYALSRLARGGGRRPTTCAGSSASA